MTDVATALQTFWNSFSLPAYMEEHVPDDAVLPYITYTVTKPEWRESAMIQGRVWYKSNSFVTLNQKVDEISDLIGDGYSVKTNTGVIVLYKDTNFVQIQPFPDDTMMRVAYLNLVLNAYTK